MLDFIGMLVELLACAMAATSQGSRSEENSLTSFSSQNATRRSTSRVFPSNPVGVFSDRQSSFLTVFL